MGIFYLCLKDGILYKYSNFVWECYNGEIPENSTIENIDGNKKNNDLKNLRLISAKVNDDDDEKREIKINKHVELKNDLRVIENYISKINMELDLMD